MSKFVAIDNTRIEERSEFHRACPIESGTCVRNVETLLSPTD